MAEEKCVINEGKEHVLVCLSSSPSNKKIIDEAAKLSKAFHSELTAIYVSKSQTENLPVQDQIRLQNNIRYAEDKNASITTMIGENIPFQIAEYARVSGVTKIVLGRSITDRYHFFSRSTITEQLISLSPDTDIYIIPDTKADKKKEYRHGLIDQIIPTWKDVIIIIAIMIIMTILGIGFSRLGFTEANIIMVYILGVLLSAIFTRSHLCSIISSLSSVLLFNFFFTEPNLTFHAYEPGYSITFVVMLAVALITSTLAYRLKENAHESARTAFRTKVLFDTNQLLQKSRTFADVLKVMANQVILLLDKKVIIYPVENGKIGKGYIYSADDEGGSLLEPEISENDVVQWVFENRKRAGATTEIYPKAKCLYHAIRINDVVYGIIGIHTDSKGLSAFEYSILVSILGEGALAMENLNNAMAREEAAMEVRKEKLRANLLRTISHDLRTPLTSISGNASTLYSRYELLDDETRKQMFTDIYDDSEWLIQLVENLLSVTRMENGEMKLNQSLEILDDVIDEAVKHTDRNGAEHEIIVKHSDEIILAQMDTKLITQVIINILNNAIKYTQKGSQILIECGSMENRAYVRISDNGPGMDDTVKKHAFDMFYTGSNKAADSKRSMGLGLALCKSVIEAHGGSIRLEDNQPTGCVFTFYLEKGQVTLNE